jgi:hypothetical protein
MPTVKDWEEYVDMEEQYDIEESRKKVLHKQKTHTKKEWDNLENKLNRKGYKKNGKQRDKKNSWSNNSKRI